MVFRRYAVGGMRTRAPLDEEWTPAKGRWCGVNGSSPMDLDGAEKTPIRKSEKFSLQDLTPPAGEERDSDQRTMGWG
jgi:hypothetical protein